MPHRWEGNRKSGVTRAVHHSLKWFILAQCLRRGLLIGYIYGTIHTFYLVMVDDVVCPAGPYGYYMGGGSGSALTTSDLMTSPAVNGSTAAGPGAGLLQAVNRC